MNSVALSEDEARMLGCPVVEPEHLLLAILRRGRVRDVLSGRVSAGDVYSAIVKRDGLGDEMVLGRVSRSRRLDGVLAAAIDLVDARGDRQIEEVHLTLALTGDSDTAQLLKQLGVGDLAAVMDERFPARGGPVGDEMSRRQRVRTELGETQRQLHRMIPAFERFTADARRAIRAALESSSLIEHRELGPFHLLIGCAQVPGSYAGRALHPIFGDGELDPVEELIDRAMRMGPFTAHQAAGILTDVTRRVVAEDALKLAYRGGHEQISTGHLLLAVLDTQDQTTALMTEPHTQRLARTLFRGLPGCEAGSDEGELAWIQFDFLLRILTLDFRRVLPSGWTVIGSRGSIHLIAPGAPAEPGFSIRPGWIIEEPGPAPERLAKVTHWMLERVQAAVIESTGAPWPPNRDGRPATAYAEIVPDRFNPTLRLGYGDPQAPMLQVLQRGQLVNMLIWRN